MLGHVVAGGVAAAAAAAPGRCQKLRCRRCDDQRGGGQKNRRAEALLDQYRLLVGPNSGMNCKLCG